ncbi:MAG TPA: hypothetical protein VFK52_00180 [Nocardioidaceae bacterium]|nr:hypothetical protein [Nocardioidaceae bacterium]
MTVAEKREAFRAAIEILVEREVTLARPNNPGAYAGSVRSRLLNDKRDHARALMEDAVLTAEQLAEALDDTPDVQAPKPTVRHASERQACSTCGCYGGGGWVTCEDRGDLGMTPDLTPCPKCAADRHRLHARTHVTEDREDLHRSHAVSVEAHREKHPESLTKEQSA